MQIYINNKLVKHPTETNLLIVHTRVVKNQDGNYTTHFILSKDEDNNYWFYKVITFPTEKETQIKAISNKFPKLVLKWKEKGRLKLPDKVEQTDTQSAEEELKKAMKAILSVHPFAYVKRTSDLIVRNFGKFGRIIIYRGNSRKVELFGILFDYDEIIEGIELETVEDKHYILAQPKLKPLPAE